MKSLNIWPLVTPPKCCGCVRTCDAFSCSACAFESEGQDYYYYDDDDANMWLFSLIFFFSAEKRSSWNVQRTDGSFHLDYLQLKISTQKLNDHWDC